MQVKWVCGLASTEPHAASLNWKMKHTISVLVEDEAGVLTRIAGLFARRGFNIESLAVGPAEQGGTHLVLRVPECAGAEPPREEELQSKLF